MVGLIVSLVAAIIVLYVYMLQSVLEEISPTWMNVSLRMKDDPATDKAFGWVLEM